MPTRKPTPKRTNRTTRSTRTSKSSSSLISRLSSKLPSSPKKRTFLLFVSLFALIGTIVLIRSFAAPNQTQPENWQTTTLTGTVAKTPDQTNSPGYLQFNSPTPPPTTGGGTVSGFPTPNNTGWKPTGVTLTPYTGPTTITQAGTVIDGKDIRSCLVIEAANVTIKRSRIQCAGYYGLQTGPGSIIEDVEITSTSLTNIPKDVSTRVDRAIAVWSQSAQLRRVYVNGTQRGIFFGEGSDGSIIEASYIGDNWNPGDPCCTDHTTSLKMQGGVQNAIIRGNTFQVNQNTNASAALVITTESSGPNDNITIDNNQLIGKGDYVATFGYDPAAEKPTTRYAITNNVFIAEKGAVYYAGFDARLFSLPLTQGGWQGLWKNNRIKGGQYDGYFITPGNVYQKTDYVN